MSNHRNRVRGEFHHAAQLTAHKVAEMRRLHADPGVCIRCLSKLYGVRYATVWDAVNYNTWKHVQE